MHATERESASEKQKTLEQSPRRSVERIDLSSEQSGARVGTLVRDRLARGSQRVVITSASLELPRELVEHAFDALRYSGIVCAPGSAGAIALIGMTEPHAALLAAIPWATDNALTALLSIAREQHVSLLLLPPPDGTRDD